MHLCRQLSWVQAAIPTAAVPTTAVPTAAIPTTTVPTTASKPQGMEEQ